MSQRRPSKMRRVPVHSVRGNDDETTETLRLLFYLHEVERQAEVFSLSLEDAVDVGEQSGATTDAWRHIQGAMFAAIVVNRFISRDQQNVRAWPGHRGQGVRGMAKRAAKWRAGELRRLLSLPDADEDSPLFTVSRIRHSLEHADERVDMALHSSAWSLSDWYLTDGLMIVTPEQAEGLDSGPAGLRAFCPEGGLLFFNTEVLDLFHLDVHMRTLRLNAREATSDLVATLRGRMRFGGGAVSMLPFELDVQQRREAWEESKRELEGRMTDSRTMIDGYVRLWLEVNG